MLTFIQERSQQTNAIDSSLQNSTTIENALPLEIEGLDDLDVYSKEAEEQVFKQREEIQKKMEEIEKLLEDMDE